MRTLRYLVVLPLLTFVLWGAIPAGANSITGLHVTCDTVTFSWAKFPDRPVGLHVHVEQGDEVTDASVSTEGDANGDTSVPVQLGDGEASATVTWTLQKTHHASVTADLHCTPETTTTTGTEPSTTSTVPESTTVAPTTVAVDCGPDTLPCTGTSSSTDAMVLGGWAAFTLGVALLFVSRPRRRAR